MDLDTRAETTGKKIGAAIKIEGLTRYYGPICAVDNVSLHVSAGEFLTLLGPSGSGKTTIMMAIAGFTELSSGSIELAGQRIDRLPPYRRNIGVVFQHLALFPHMTVIDNVAFPLRMRGVANSEAIRRANDTLELVHLSGFEQRFPHELSGGQQQRVAVARAIVFQPPVLLLDEPLGALDRKLRDSMQRELRAIHRALGMTILHVTHDQSEAIAISDRVAIVSEGRIRQLCAPRELYEHPTDKFVADFVGKSNFLLVTIADISRLQCAAVGPGGMKIVVDEPDPKIQLNHAAVAMIRPERITLSRALRGVPNEFQGVVRDRTYMGGNVRFEVVLSGDALVFATISNDENAVLYEVGDNVVVRWRPQDVQLFLN